MKPSDFLTELSNEKLAKYKTAAAADASKADKEGDFKKGDKRFKGINTATKKQFDNDAKKVDEGVAVDPQQIQQIFKSAQDIQSAGGAANLVGGGSNRTAIGKVKDMFSTPKPVAAPGLKQSTSLDPSVSAAEQPTTPAGQAAQAARQQRQAAATASLNQPLGSTSVPAGKTGLPVRNADNTRIRTGDMSAYTKPNTSATAGLSAIAPKRVSAKPGEVNGLQMRNESFELSESQIYRLIGRIVKEHKKQVDEGILDWAKTKGQNLTTKITADKLLQAWKKAGSPTDSDQIADILVKAGVPQETLNNLYTNFKLPAAQPISASTLPVDAQPATATSNTSRPFTGSINSYDQAGQPSVSPSPSTSSTNRMATGSNAVSTSSQSAGPKSFQTVNDAKDAIDNVLDGLNGLKRRNRVAAVRYGASEFGKLAQQSQQAAAPANAKQPKPANLRVSGGNPGAPTPDEQANLERRIQQASGQTNESVGLPYPGTYEETNDMFKSSGQRRIGTLTTEDDQIDGMAQGEIREIIKNAVHIKNQLDKGVSLDGWMYSYVTTSNDHLNSVAEQINNPNIDEEKVRLDPKCWTGKHKEGTKMKGGVRVNNCVPNESAIFKGIKG